MNKIQSRVIKIDSMPEIETGERVKEATKIVIKFLATLPDEKYIELAKTGDQIELLGGLKRLTDLCVQYWASILAFRNDPLESLVTAGDITVDDYKWTINTVDVYKQLWELIQVSEKYVKNEIEIKGGTYPWTGIYSAAGMMATILSDWVDSKARAFLAPYYKASAKDSVLVAEFAKQVIAGANLAQSNRIKPILSATGVNKLSYGAAWFLFVRLVAEKKAKRDSIVRSKLQALDIALINLADGEITEKKRKRGTAKRPKVRSFEIRQGFVHYAGRNGGTYT